MIRPIDIRLNAAHPELPLAEAVTFTDAPSTVLIRGVPPNCGRWAITAVSVAATYPDGSTTTRAAVQSANGVWVATLPATARSGRTENGLRVMADGIDENGASVTGYILGVADFAVASLGVTPAPQPGETSWQMLYFDAVPGTLRKGDVAKVDGVLKLYNGTAWEAFATPPALDDTVKSSSPNGVKSSGIWSAIWGALSALPSGFTSLYDWVVSQLAGKVPTSRKVNGKALSLDVELDADDVGAYPATDTEGEYESDKNLYVNGRTRGEHVQARSPSDYTDWCDVATLLHIAAEFDPQDKYAQNALVTFREGENWKLYKCVAANGHTGNWNSNDFQEATVEDILAALRTGKQDALSAQQLANIAAVSDALAFDATHSYAAGDPVVYLGTLYTFTATHTGAWTGSDVSAVNIIARLAGKLDKSGDTMTGSLHMGDNFLKWRNGNLIYWLSTNGLYIWDDGDDVTHSPSYIIEFPLASGTLALTSAIPYALVTKTISDNAVTLDDRASNAVTVSATLSPNTLTINFPTAPTGKLRDFAMRLNIAAGVTAPEIAWPQGVTLENNGGEVPEIADGGTGGSSTILYFSESENNGTTAKFLVKGETLTAITQA